MEIKIQVGADERIYDVLEDIAVMVEEAMSGAVRSDNTLRSIHKPLVETFYGPAPEGGEFLATYLARIRLGKKGDRMAWDGLYELLMMKHPQATALRSVEFQLLEGRGTPEERVHMRDAKKDLGRRIRSVAAGMRSRVLRYYLADFAPVRGIATRPTVRKMVEATLVRFQNIIDRPTRFTVDDALLALNVVTLLHSVLGQPTPLPPAAFAAHLAGEGARANAPAPALVTH